MSYYSSLLTSIDALAAHQAAVDAQILADLETFSDEEGYEVLHEDCDHAAGYCEITEARRTARLAARSWI